VDRLGVAIGYQYRTCGAVAAVRFAARLGARGGSGQLEFGDPNATGEYVKNWLIWAPPEDVKQRSVPSMRNTQLHIAVQQDPNITPEADAYL
jgi:hypothetical protein